MKLKKGDKVKIIQRKSGNTTGAENCGKPNGDVGSIGFITEINRESTYCVEDGTKYYGYFDKDDLELVTDEFILPEKWCVKVGDPATKSVFDKWRRSNTTYSGYSGSVGYLSQDGFFSSQKLSTEITYDQFKTHVLKETMEPKQLDLTGRYLKVIDNKTIDHYPCRVGDYLKFAGIKNGMEFWGAYNSDCDKDGTDNSRYYGFNVHTNNKSFELMPEGFDPNKPTFEVGKWYKNLGRFSDHIGKLCGEVSEDRFPCKEYISDEIYTDNGNFFGHFKNAVLLTDLSEIQEYLPDGHVDKVQATPEYVKCTVTWMNDHTLGTIYKVYKDGYVENDNKERSGLTWNGGGFEKSTKEAYDAQQDPNVFKAGTYIVLLASCDGKNCWKSSIPINHCYILKSDSHSLNIHIELDKQGSTNNGWSCGSYYDSKMKIRAATPKEIAEYDRLGKPYDVTTLGKVKGEVDMKDIQRQCKEKYPIGSVVEDVGYSIEHCLEDDGCIYSIHGNQIYSIYGKGLLYDNGKWAKLISLPESKKSESLLEEAKRRYPVGTKFKPAHANQTSEYCIVTDDCKFDLYSGGITSRITTVKNGIHEVWVEPGMHPEYGNTSLSRMVYYDGKWAEIVPEESKPEKYIPRVGDWVITEGYSNNYDGKPLKINKINDGIFCFFDEVNFYDDYDKRHNFHIDKAIRKAEPHEIPKTLEGVDFKLNICDEIPLTIPQVSLWGEPAPSTPNYLDPASLLPKIKLPI